MYSFDRFHWISLVIYVYDSNRNLRRPSSLVFCLFVFHFCFIIYLFNKEWIYKGDSYEEDEVVEMFNAQCSCVSSCCLRVFMWPLGSFFLFKRRRIGKTRFSGKNRSVTLEVMGFG